MIDLTMCTTEQLRADSTFVLYRVCRAGVESTLLSLVPRLPTIRSLERLEREYALAATLDPGLAVIPLQLHPQEQGMMLTLEDPGGEMLSTLMKEPIEIQQRLRIAIDLATAMIGLQRVKLLHRDIRPANIIVTHDRGVRLTGFANAAYRDDQSPELDLDADTLPYIAPERTGRVAAPVDRRSDLYAAGVTLYELFTGTFPFTASTPEEWIHSHAVRPPVPLNERVEDIPSQLSSIVLKLLSKDPACRYQTAEGLKLDLQQCLEDWTRHKRVRGFLPGMHDSVPHIRSPETLYGRTRHTDALREAFETVSTRGRISVCLISGPSGIGKSSLVARFQSELASRNVLVASSKFDVQMQGVPYAALTQAFGSLLRQVLTYDEARMSTWRQALTEAVGLDGYLVNELIPASELLIGRQSPTTDLTPQDRLARLRIVFRRLVGAFTRFGQPLVLFVDDLQWLEVATLDLLGDLVSRHDLSNLMLIGAYRSAEIGPFHPLQSLLHTIRSSNTSLKEIALEPLSVLDVCLLTSETLACSGVRARPLANMVHAKTGGNPFFATQFLQTLNDEGLLTYDQNAREWKWDIPRVRAVAVSDNVADLMAAKVASLAEVPRQTLLMLACLGSTAESELLATALGQSDTEVQSALRPALLAGLICQNGSSYCFAHDRIQEAAYGIGSVEDRSKLHLRTGIALAMAITTRETSERLYITANQLNRGLLSIESEETRAKTIEINLAAGRRARSAAAYSAATAYLKVAQQLLGERAHPSCSSTAFEIALLAAECELLLGHFEVAERQLTLLWQNCPDIPISADVARLRSNLHTVLGQPKRSVDVCLEYLRQINIDWSPNPTDLQVDEEGRRLSALVSKLSDEELHALPSMTDAISQATLGVLSDLVTPALLTNLNLCNITIFAAAGLTLTHGICEGSSYPLVCVFSVFHVRYAEVRTGLRLAHFAVLLANRWPTLKISGRTLTAFGKWVTPWVLPVRSGLPYIRRGLEIALATGDLNWVTYCQQAYISMRLYAGEPLQSVFTDAEEALSFSDNSAFELLSLQLKPMKRLAASLLANDENDSFNNRGPSELIRLDSRTLQNDCFVYAAQIQLDVLAERFDLAAKLTSESLFRNIRAYLEVADYRFYAALAHAAQCTAAPPNERERYLDTIRRHHQQFATWCSNNEENFIDRATLLAAELARLENRELEAERLYEDAIRLARTSGFVQIEAIASECAARFYAARGIRTVVSSYLINARDCYLRWGAHAKVRQLEQTHPHLPGSDLVRTSSTSVLLTRLDINALFKASRALSGEIEFDTLIRTLMTIVIEHAVAERGILFLMNASGPHAVAEAVMAVKGINVAVRESGFRGIEFSQAALNYVVRTRIALDSAAPTTESLLVGDSYLHRRPGLSLYCFPIMAQTNLIGVLYLESPAKVGIITPQRAAVLDALAAQAAISLENARLYSQLQRSEAFLADGQSISHTGSWSWDRQTRRLTWSDEHQRIFGIEPGNNVVPTLFLAFRMIHPDDRQSLAAKLRSSILMTFPFSHDFRLIRLEQVKHLHVVGRPVLSEAGQLTSYIGTTIDMSEYKRTQEALQEAQLDLARASRLAAIGELSSLIAHEVRQPLTAMAAQARACQTWLAHDPPQIEEAFSAAGKIGKGARRASSIVESIRQMARKTAPSNVAVDVHDAISEVASLLGGELKRGKVSFRLNLAAGSHLVRGDRVQLQQVVMNLIMNSIEALVSVHDHPRSILVSTEVDEGKVIFVSVADSGIGLPPAATKRLFEAFFTTKAGGLGVGLAICRSIIDAHGGKLWTSPNQPFGTVFRFTLPISVAEVITERRLAD